MAGLCVVLLLYVVLISLAGATWARLWEGFDPEETTRVACEVREASILENQSFPTMTRLTDDLSELCGRT